MIKITLNIDGMACGMCEAHINDAIRSAFNPKKVTSSHAKGETVIITDTDVSDEKLKETVEATGYKLISVKKEEYLKKSLFSIFKKD